MNVDGNPYVIEYNVRMGDPETEAVLPRIKTDLLSLFVAASEKKLDKIKLNISDEAAATVIVVSGGYPGHYEKNKIITGIDEVTESIVFHSGTASNNEHTLTAGGRVLAISSFGKDIFEAIEKSYRSVKKIQFDNMYFRKDLGTDLK
jgi:phosphoribosylamine--glycine ligase